MGRNEDIAGQAGLQTGIERSDFGNHEAEAVAMHGQAANQHISSLGGLRNGVALGGDLQQLALPDECVEAVSQFPAGFAFHAEFAQELLMARRFLGLAGDVAKDGGIGKHQFSVPGSQFSVFGSVAEN